MTCSNQWGGAGATDITLYIDRRLKPSRQAGVVIVLPPGPSPLPPRLVLQLPVQQVHLGLQLIS